MMFGLPPSTEVNKVIPKKEIIGKANLAGNKRAVFDSTIHRIVIVNEISPRTVNLPAGSIERIFVLKVELRNEDCDDRILQVLFKSIEQKIIVVLQSGIRIRPVVQYGALVKGDWALESELSLKLEGLDIGEAWEKLVIQVGHIRIEDGNDLSMQIAEDEIRSSLQNEIKRLEKSIGSECQPRKKREIYRRIQELKESLRDD